jgi:hypothetical protein
MLHPADNTNPIDLLAGYALEDLTPEEAAYLQQAITDTPLLH